MAAKSDADKIPENTRSDPTLVHVDGVNTAFDKFCKKRAAQYKYFQRRINYAREAIEKSKKIHFNQKVKKLIKKLNESKLQSVEYNRILSEIVKNSNFIKLEGYILGLQIKKERIANLLKELKIKINVHEINSLKPYEIRLNNINLEIQNDKKLILAFDLICETFLLPNRTLTFVNEPKLLDFLEKNIKLINNLISDTPNCNNKFDDNVLNLILKIVNAKKTKYIYEYERLAQMVQDLNKTKEEHPIYKQFEEVKSAYHASALRTLLFDVLRWLKNFFLKSKNQIQKNHLIQKTICLKNNFIILPLSVLLIFF